MTAGNWIRYCRDKVYKRGAKAVNGLKWLDQGVEHACAKSGKCNPWICTWFADGCGMYCGEKPAKAAGIPYYIPDPFDTKIYVGGDNYSEADRWKTLVNKLPGRQLTLFE